MSYVRFDDRHENGRLSDFRARLSSELEFQTGEKFPIFQDRNDISWGEEWRARIDQGLDGATFFIPILTPGFFKSTACREETETFLEQEQKLGRRDLILAVYYFGCPVLDEPAKRRRDKVAKELAKRQWVDWRELRFEPWASPEVGKTIQKLAGQVRGALERPISRAASRPALSNPPTRRRPTRPATTKSAEASKAQAPEAAPSRKTDPPTITVDPLHRGDHPSISEAIAAAAPGTRILVKPGLYQEGLVIDKPIEIIGAGDLDEIVVRAHGRNVVLFRTTLGRIANLTLRQPSGGEWFCVHILQGRLELEGCDISSESLASVAIGGGADPRVRRNRIHDGSQGGVMVFDSAQGLLEDNDIHGNGLAGVEILDGGNPTLRRNHIRRNNGGVFFHSNGQGLVEDNDIHSDALAGVTIMGGSNPTLRRNQIHDGDAGGVFVSAEGRGVLEENEISRNAFAGIEIKENGDPVLRRNAIHTNRGSGIWVHDRGKGRFKENDVRDNEPSDWSISSDSEPRGDVGSS